MNSQDWEKEYRRYCGKQGVQIFVTSDVLNSTSFYVFQNSGSKLVRIEHNSEVVFLEPGEKASFKILPSLNRDFREAFPKVDALNGGFGGD